MFGFFDVIQDILSNLRTFGLRDVIDIAVVSLAMYQILLFARKSRAGQLVRGLLLLLVFYALADVMQLRTVRWVLTNVMQIGFIAAIVLFQPELRRTLEHMGQSTNWTKLLFTTHRQDPTLRGAWQSAVVAICDAAEQLSDTRTGALMVLERMNNLDEIIRTGTPLSADVIPEMLGTIFYEGTPLHDGAVVIRDGRIVAAGCVLPLSNNLEMGKDMGTRHRAGLGMSENSDAIVVVVSEETGIISLAKNGVLIRRLDRQNLFNLLQEVLASMQKQTQPAEPVRKANGSIWDNRFFLGIVSVLAAVLVWMVVSTFLDPQGSFVIKDVSVNYGYQSTIYTSKGLDIVDQQAVDNVQVQADGNGTLIGKLSSSDIMVYPVYNGVQGAGKTTLRLEARITNTDYTNVGIKLTVLSPQTVDVVFDTVGEKTLPVTTDTSGITIADGFTLNRITTTPTEVTLTGPTSELDKISEVVAPVSHEGSLSDSVSTTASLELRDENGDIVTPEYTTLDSNTADINLTVYQVRELPLSIVFINAPSGFDTSYLKYSLSIPTLNVAGPAKTVGALTELSVAAFDLGREFAFDRDYQKNIELPAGVVSLDGVSAVTIRFDTTDMTSRTFTVTNIRTVNVPSTIDLEVLTTQIHQVTLYGPKSEMEELSADSILAQVDCQNLAVSVGQQTVAASIQVPSSSHIFAVGNYTVQCQASSQ